MPPTLPDEADTWARAWRERLADRQAFAEAAGDLTATVRFEIRPDDGYDGDPVAVGLSVADGRPIEAGVDRTGGADVTVAGPYGAWKDLLRGETGVTAAVMSGPFEVTGSTATLLRRREAVAEMVRAAREMDVTFAY